MQENTDDTKRATRNVQSFLADMLRENDIDPDTHHVTGCDLANGELTVTTSELRTDVAYRAMAKAVVESSGSDVCQVEHRGVLATVYNGNEDRSRYAEAEQGGETLQKIELSSEVNELILAASELGGGGNDGW